jgi:hypothetical protein
MKVGKSARRTVALLTLAYGEYALKKSSVFEWHRQFKITQEMSRQKHKGKCGQSTNER